MFATLTSATTPPVQLFKRTILIFALCALALGGGCFTPALNAVVEKTLLHSCGIFRVKLVPVRRHCHSGSPALQQIFSVVPLT